MGLCDTKLNSGLLVLLLRNNIYGLTMHYRPNMNIYIHESNALTVAQFNEGIYTCTLYI